jgi:hypothetical protein
MRLHFRIRMLFRRRNDRITLTVRPAFDDQNRPLYPYGAVPRLLLLWIATEAVHTRSRILYPAETVPGFMRDIGLNPDNGSVGAKRSDARRLRCPPAARPDDAPVPGDDLRRCGRRRLQGMARRADRAARPNHPMFGMSPWRTTALPNRTNRHQLKRADQARRAAAGHPRRRGLRAGTWRQTAALWPGDLLSASGNGGAGRGQPVPGEPQTAE